jgi:hypothetical protein
LTKYERYNTIWGRYVVTTKHLISRGGVGMNQKNCSIGTVVMTVQHKTGPVQVGVDSNDMGRPVVTVQSGAVDVFVNQTPKTEQVQIAFRYDLEESLSEILHLLRVAEVVCRFGKRVGPDVGFEEEVISEENPIWTIHHGHGQLPAIFSVLPTAVPLRSIAEIICFCLSQNSKSMTCQSCSVWKDSQLCPFYPEGMNFCLALRSLPSLAERLPLRRAG